MLFDDFKIKTSNDFFDCSASELEVNNDNVVDWKPKKITKLNVGHMITVRLIGQCK